MKHPYSFAAAFIGLAPAFSGAFKHKSSTTTTIAPETSTDFAPTPTFNPNPPICGAGFTYCGYILRDSQNFNEYDILQTYCSAHKHNCPNGKPRTDPYQALYLCVPPAAPEQPHGKSPVPPPRLPDQPNPLDVNYNDNDYHYAGGNDTNPYTLAYAVV
ncbi:uncharacterized protein CTHT_0027830 [Thermochaetoides thermophila DSM 1495]|uniref:Uncharacterized protein n=1 Tax=Chaetomium thermophilum (strain DSM 1495 / CBS 144.50 / IMI 039719) TaxID=759272 RepID=G0S789_CHATD|nr:hypothetical protein CTHT_0027830 [Thermochaetoides thermophila DSM 1495]EGS20944.1 hypothetical protein CTHT_0027830 [Thermochaetoides thermophila DSM 1495]